MPLHKDFKNFKQHQTSDGFVTIFNQYANGSIDADKLNQFVSMWQTNPDQNGMAGQAIMAVTDFTNRSLSEPTVGASGAVFGCLAAFGYLFPNNELILFPIPIPIKAKWFVLGYIAFELYSSWQTSAGDNIAHMAHLGGALVGFLLVYFWNKTNRRQFY